MNYEIVENRENWCVCWLLPRLLLWLLLCSWMLKLLLCWIDEDAKVSKLDALLEHLTYGNDMETEICAPHPQALAPIHTFTSECARDNSGKPEKGFDRNEQVEQLNMQFSWFLTVSIGIKSNYETCIDQGMHLNVTRHKLCTKIYVIIPITPHKRHNLYFIRLSTLFSRRRYSREMYAIVHWHWVCNSSEILSFSTSSAFDFRSFSGNMESGWTPSRSQYTHTIVASICSCIRHIFEIFACDCIPWHRHHHHRVSSVGCHPFDDRPPRRRLWISSFILIENAFTIHSVNV